MPRKKATKSKMYKIVPTEAQEQYAVMQWARLNKVNLVHHANEGRRTNAEGARLKALGLAVGYPDLSLNVARGGYFGLFIELKRNRVYTPSEINSSTWQAQLRWLDALQRENYVARMCFGFDMCRGLIEKYILLPETVRFLTIKI